MSYQLKKTHLINYARVMVHYALNGGKGINAGETVYLVGNESAKDLYMAIYNEIVAAGGNVIHHYLPDEFDRFNISYEMAKNGREDQLNFFPMPYYSGLLESIDHHIAILSTAKMHVLEGTPPEASIKMMNAMSQFFAMRGEKELKGKLSWTMCHYGTAAAAAEVGMSEKEYWRQIIAACYLDDPDPVEKWKALQRESEVIRGKLDALKIEKLHIQGTDVDLHITIGANRKWLGGTGRNIPSFEIFTTPDWRGTNGWISFNQPLYYLGQRISGIHLAFHEGKIFRATATENEDVLVTMISQDDADKLGEFSLTDSRHSPITRFMANTLYDENTGGQFGNTHVAVGRCFREAYTGDIGLIQQEEDWHTHLGFNKCKKVHVDMISTSNRTVTATLQTGEEVVIYTNGQFTLI